MKASRKELVAAILKVVGQSADSRQASKAIAAYLIAERRTRELDGILRDVEKLREQQAGIIEITASSAYPLSAANKATIEALFVARKTIIHEEEDKQLIGGVKVRALSRSADFSVQARLRQLRRSV